MENAIGFFVPGKERTIQNFKYDHDSGYVELIGGIVGGEKNKRKYYSGWCQFIQLAKSFGGKVAKKPGAPGKGCVLRCRFACRLY